MDYGNKKVHMHFLQLIVLELQITCLPNVHGLQKKRKNRENIELDSWDHWDSRANDIWTLGVALFMMLFACPPYDSCSNSDNRFIYLTKGDYIPAHRVKEMKPRNASLRALVKAYKRLDMVTEDCLEFLEGFFKRESSRWTWETMMQHKWITTL